MTRTTRTLLTLAVVLAFIATFTSFSYAQARITKQIDESQMVTMAGNTRHEANINNDRGAVPDSMDVDHILLLLQRSPQKERQFEKLIDSMNDKNSPNFHKWLTADEIGKRFGAAPEDIATVTNWLESHGFRINQVYPATMMIDFSGPAGQVRTVFHTEIHQLNVNGESHIANMSDPMIPATLAPVVKGIVSLHDFKPRAFYRVKPDYTFSGCATATLATWTGTCYALTAQDVQTIYNLNPLYAAGFSGQGQTIAVIEDTDTYDSTGPGTEWNTYRDTFGLSAAYPLGTYTQVHPGCSDPGTTADDGEAAIDVEMATAAAPSATVELVSCASAGVTFGGLTALQGLVNGSAPYPGVVSVSYGDSESDNGAGGNAAFYVTYQTASAEGITVFGASGDGGPADLESGYSANYPSYGVLTSLSISGWTETPYNVAVGGTDFEDIFDAKVVNTLGGQTATVPVSTYWNSSNSATYESAKGYIPEIPWNESCGSVLIADYVNSSYTTYGSSGFCNNSKGNSTTNYMSEAAAAGGASNCATGSGGTAVSEYGVVGFTCQGYSKPGFQSGSSLAGGKAVYGQPKDGARDIPDISAFASSGVWGHFATVCWNDPSYTANGAAVCTGAPSSWSGFGGTSVASPLVAGMQALVNQRTGQSWGIGALTNYYQMGQNEYGQSGGTFAGTACNSSGAGGPASSCVFNDVTQGDIVLPCEKANTSIAECYAPTGTHGVTSTDVITAAVIINGGTGYTSAPTCAIAGPSNNNPYKSPAGTTLWAGGTQATCTATVTATTTTAKWTVQFANLTNTTLQDGLLINVGPQTYTVTGTGYTAMATAFNTWVNANSTVATSTVSSGTVTLTAKTAGYAGNFTVSMGNNNYLFQNELLYINQTTAGQGPNYVSAITITAGGSGYAPQTPVTITGAGSGAIVVANTSYGTAASTYQPAYGAAPGWDMATGLGTPNAYNFVCNSVWGSTCAVATTTAVTSSLNPSTYGQSVTFTAAVTPSTATGNVTFTIDGVTGSPIALSGGSATYSTANLTVGTHTVSATYGGAGVYTGSTGTLSPVQTVSSATAGVGVSCTPNPSNYTQSVTCTATISGQYGLIKGHSKKPMDVTGNVTWSANTGCGTTPVTSGASGTATCTTTALPVGTDTIEADYSGDSNHQPGSGTTSEVVSSAASSTAVLSSSNPSAYGQAVSFTATVTGNSPAGTVQFYVDSSLFDTETLISGTATSASISTLAVGTHTVTATYSGDSNNSGSTGTLAGGQVVGAASTTTSVIGSPNPSVYATSVTFTATVSSDTGLVKGRKQSKKPLEVTGNVTWSANTGCGPSTISGGIATCTTSAATHLPVGSNTVTATYAGDSNHSGSAGSEVQVVTGGIATTIDVTSVSPASEDYGSVAPVTITALLSWTGHGVAPTASNVTISGNGTGTYGATSCAPRVHETMTCTAVFTPAGTDLPGTYTETATFSGDTNYSGSSSSETNNFAINQATSTTSVVGTPNPSTYATSVTFTATITGENGLARRNMKRKSLDIGGTVTWSSNTGCTTTTVTGGVATCTTSAATHLPVGANTVTATYSGDANHSGSTGSMVQNVTGGIATTIDVTGVSPAAEDFGADSPVTITALLSWTGHGVAPTASNVTISGNGNGTYGATSCAARVHETMTCTATYTPSNADVPGAYTETAAFSGDSNYTGSTSPETNNFAINGATSTTSVVGNPNPSTYATSVTFTATITSNTGNVKGGAKQNGAKPMDFSGTVTWSSNTGCSPSTVSGGYPGFATCTTSAATHLPVGANTVTATYSGDSNHSGSTGTMTQNVTGGIATTINVTNVSPASETYAADTPVTITAVLTWTGHGTAPTASNVTIGGNGNGTYGATSCGPRSGDTITCTATYTPSAADVVGSYTETAAFSGDVNYSGSTSPQTNNLAITAATSTTAVTSGLNPSTYGGAVTFTATISGENEAARRNAKRKPLDVTGTVTWSANTGCSASTVSGYPGVATCTTSSLLGGTDSVTATYAGDSNHIGSAGTVSQVVNKASQTISCGSFPSSETYGTSFTASCSANSSLPVSYASAGGCSNSGATYTMTSGTTACLVTVTQAGNGNYSAATPFNGSVNATKASQTINVTTGAPPTATNGSSFTIVASASSGLPITYSSSGACTNSGATYTINSKTGTCHETMAQGGDTNYNPATSVLESTLVKAAVKPVVSFTGMPTTAAYETTFTVTASSNETGSYVSIPVITSTTPAVCSVSGATTSGTSVSATVTMLSGTQQCTLKAAWAANYVYAAKTATTHTTAKKATPSVTFTGAPATAANGSSFTVTTTSNESGSNAVVPTITSTTTLVCSLGAVTSNGSGGYQATVTMKKATGTCTTKATWPTNNYYAGVSATQSTGATP